MKGIINLKGYRIEVDENIHLGKYCFMAHHERERTFYFYTESEKPMKDWLKALMKATIARDFASKIFVVFNLIYMYIDISFNSSCHVIKYNSYHFIRNGT
jgi:hypothetical protein